MSSFSDFLPLVFLVVALIGAAVQIFRNRQGMTPALGSEIVLTWFFAVEVGLGGLWAFMGHTLFADQVAASIGWPAGNPFQQEVGLTNLAFGVLGLLSVRMPRPFQLATIIGYAIFMIGAGIGHLYQAAAFGNLSPNNTGTVLSFDLAIPVLLFVLYLLSGRGSTLGRPDEEHRSADL